MAVKRGLGKGLDGLIPKETEEEKRKNSGDSNEEEQKIPIRLIDPNQGQPRKQFSDESLRELADSIVSHGVLQPILLQKKGNRYEIVAGERRWRAARLAGLQEVPALVRKFSDQEILEISLIENLQREDLNPMEEARAYKRLSEEFSMKQEEIAKRVSKSRAAVANSMRLLQLGEKVQEMLEEGAITSGHARALLALNSKDKQEELAQAIQKEGLSVRETENLVKRALSPTKKQSAKKPLPDEAVYREAEETLKRALGAKVSIVRKDAQRGKITIEYFSADELDRLYERLKRN